MAFNVKWDIPDSHRCTLNLYLSYNEEDIIVLYQSGKQENLDNFIEKY